MEPANKPSLRHMFRSAKGKAPKGITVVEYLPDADEIERSPVPRYAQITLQMMVAALVVFGDVDDSSVSELRLAFVGLLEAFLRGVFE